MTFIRSGYIAVLDSVASNPIRVLHTNIVMPRPERYVRRGYQVMGSSLSGYPFVSKSVRPKYKMQYLVFGW